MTHVLAKLINQPIWRLNLLVKKKTGVNFRMPVDYRVTDCRLQVRAATYSHTAMICLGRLSGARYLSWLDAASGFHQIMLKDEDKPT